LISSAPSRSPNEHVTPSGRGWFRIFSGRFYPACSIPLRIKLKINLPVPIVTKPIACGSSTSLLSL
jgi:hypothetical protein